MFHVAPRSFCRFAVMWSGAAEVLKQLCAARRKAVWQFLINIHLLCDPAVPLLGIYPRGKKTTTTYFHTDLFTATLSLIAPSWNITGDQIQTEAHYTIEPDQQECRPSHTSRCAKGTITRKGHPFGCLLCVQATR